MRITLLNGLNAYTEEIAFDPSSYRFYWGAHNQDITDLISRADKRTFPGFDDTVENLRLSNQRTGASAGFENEDWFSIFGEQMLTDPLTAPISALDTGVSKILSSSGIWFIALLAVIGFVLWFTVKKS